MSNITTSFLQVRMTLTFSISVHYAGALLELFSLLQAVGVSFPQVDTFLNSDMSRFNFLY